MLRTTIRLYRDAFSGLDREIWLVSVVLLVNRAGTMVFPFVSLYLTKERGFSVTEAGWLLALYGTGAIAGALLGGWASDRLGTKVAQSASLIASGFALVALAFVRGLFAIAVALFVVGVVAEAFRPAVMASIAERAPPALQAKAFALLRLAANLGLGIGPALGGWLALHGYGALFAVDAGTCWLAAVLVLVWLTPPKRLVTEVEPSATPERRSPWLDPPFLALMLVVVGVAAVIFQIFTTYPLYLDRACGLRENGVGMMLAFNAGLIVAFEMVLIHVVRHYPPLKVAATGVLVLCIGFAATPLTPWVPWVMFTVLVWSLGEMLALPMLNVVVAARAPAASRGRYLGLYTMSFSVALVFAPACGTWVYDHFGATVLWYGVGAWGLLLAGATLALEPVVFDDRARRRSP